MFMERLRVIDLRTKRYMKAEFSEIKAIELARKKWVEYDKYYSMKRLSKGGGC